MLVPLRAAGATKETRTARRPLSPPGFRLKTAKLTGLREVPVASLRESDFKEGTAISSAIVCTEKAELDRKLDTIRLPKMDFRDANIVDVIKFLNEQSRVIDEQQSGGDGVNIVLGGGLGDTDSKVGSGAGTPAIASGAGTPAITLNLLNVPLRDALRYVTDIAGLKFVVDKTCHPHRAGCLSAARDPANA